MELDALSDLERPGRPVLVRLPALCNARLQFELVVGEGEELACGAENAGSALVLHEERVGRGRGLDQRDPDRAALLEVAGWLGPGGRGSAFAVAAAAGGRKEPKEGNRHADDCAAADELPSADLPGPVLVDQMVLDLAALPSNLVDSVLRLVHVASPSQKLGGSPLEGLV